MAGIRYCLRLTWALAVAMLMCARSAFALPGDAATYIPVLQDEIQQYWPALDMPSMLGSLVEQESGWKVGATLRTSRELGCGFGQFTQAKRADGSVRFDALEETKRLSPTLSAWSWRDCYNARFQLRAVTLKMKAADRQCSPLMRDAYNSHACAASAYNGGYGGVIKRIRGCSTRSGCNARIWFGHLENICAASNTRVAGYGESFCQINSKYPYRVLVLRRTKYQFMDKVAK